ncbi:MAG: aminodeoxychorismate synthase component I [Bacteroidetes bacterium]|nr:aminodeoxychorismate synthase component I [Bacteroidota bacterium]
MTISEFELTLNDWGRKQIPFLFLVDFEMERPCAWPLNQVPGEILFSMNGISNVTGTPRSPLTEIKLNPQPISPNEYNSRFNFVKKRILLGDSYLVNLTIKTPLDLKGTLEEIYFRTNTSYKLWWKENFLVFSPETFVQIKNKKIFSYPMKGTVDASLPDAEEMLMQDIKELSEHITIVDLIRNDLSVVSTNVQVTKFRYLEKIKTNKKDLLQTSSEIAGDLPENYILKLGSILVSLLPAGSISGAPKNETIKIIKETEKETRGYYTGVMGIFDGQNLDSAVMIRFIEQAGHRFYYRSGGGITSQSEARKEYQEIVDKIYVPVY